MIQQTDRQSDTLSQAALSKNACIMKAYKGELPMHSMAEWVKWRAPQLAVSPWMREELKKCEDEENVAQTIRATVQWLDNTRITLGSDNWPASKMPLALLPDIYSTSTFPRADP